MKTYHLYLLLLLASCVESKNAQISGTFYPDSVDNIYIYRLDYFSRSNDSLIIDSIKIHDDKSFSYTLGKNSPQLLYLTTSKATPPTVSYFNKYPEYYYYSFCSKFFSSGVYLYADPGNSITIDWINNEWPKDSIIYGGAQGEIQQFMRNLYAKISKEEFDQELRLDGGYKELDPKKALILINKAKGNMAMYASEKMPQDVSTSFKNYIATEIELGALNQFLNWYEYVYRQDITKSFRSRNLPDLYTNCYETYISKIWDTSSIEFYKFLEKYITFKINIEKGDFQNYYTDKDLKIQHAVSLPYENISNLYLSRYGK